MTLPKICQRYILRGCCVALFNFAADKLYANFYIYSNRPICGLVSILYSVVAPPSGPNSQRSVAIEYVKIIHWLV